LTFFAVLVFCCLLCIVMVGPQVETQTGFRRILPTNDDPIF
jgi:hypothetical protein